MQILIRLFLVVFLAFAPSAAMPQTIGTPEYINTPSDFPIVYTVGDPKPMVSGLNAVAMIFGGGDSTANSFMGSGIAAMVIASLISMLTGSISLGRMNVGGWALSVLLTFALFYPKTTVKVTSYFDVAGGNSGASQLYFVDNVPIGLAFPAGIFGMIGQRISGAFDTTFTAADSGGGFLALGTDGFAKPLRILLGARDAFSCRNNSNYCNNLISYGKYCTHPASGVKANTSVLSAVDGIKQFFDSQTTGTMVWWQPDGQGVFAPCPAAAQSLYDAMVAYAGNSAMPTSSPYKLDMQSSFANDLAAKMGMGDAKSEAPNSMGGIGADSSYNIASLWTQQLGATLGADQNAIMMNLVFPPHIKAMIEASSSENAEATYQQILREGMERARVDMAGEGSMFVNFSMSTMNLFTFLFIAFTPIIALVIAAMGAQSVKLVIQYMVFGLWTQTWMPTAAIISYYAQTSFFSKISNLKSMGMLSPEHIDVFYQDLANTMATSGTFMAATPLITLSLLTASIYGIAQLANKAGGSGAAYLDENKGAPDVNKAANVDAISKGFEQSTGHAFAGGGGLNTAGPAQAGSGAEAQMDGTYKLAAMGGTATAINAGLSQRRENAVRAANAAKVAHQEKYGHSYETSLQAATRKGGGQVEDANTGGGTNRTLAQGGGESNRASQTDSGTTNAYAGVNAGGSSGKGSSPSEDPKALPGQRDFGKGKAGNLLPNVLSAKFGADTAAQYKDDKTHGVEANSTYNASETLQAGGSNKYQKDSSASTGAGASSTISAAETASAERVRSLENTVAQAASAEASAATRSEQSDTSGAIMEVPMQRLRNEAIDNHVAGAGKQQGVAGGAAMRAADTAIGVVAGSNEREAALKEKLSSAMSGYLNKSGYSNDRAVLAALQEMATSPTDIGARAAGVAGLAAFAKAVHDPAANALSERADRASDNARAFSGAQAALQSLGSANFSEVAARAQSGAEAIASTAALVGGTAANPAGDNIPSAPNTHKQVAHTKAAVGSFVANARQEAETYLATGQGNAQAVKASIAFLQKIDNAKNAGKVLELENSPEFKRAYDALKKSW